MEAAERVLYEWMLDVFVYYKQLLDQAKAEADNTYRDLDIPDITKTESSNCFIYIFFEINNDKYAVARYRFDIAPRNHASRARKLQISHLFASR